MWSSPGGKSGVTQWRYYHVIITSAHLCQLCFVCTTVTQLWMLDDFDTSKAAGDLYESFPLSLVPRSLLFVRKQRVLFYPLPGICLQFARNLLLFFAQWNSVGKCWCDPGCSGVRPHGPATGTKADPAIRECEQATARVAEEGKFSILSESLFIMVKFVN